MRRTELLRTENALLRYVASARPAQRLIGDTLTQVAGFALLLMTSPGRAGLAEGALLGAGDSATRALDDVRAIRAPEAAAHHHHHLREAADALLRACGDALACRRRADADEHDRLVRTLRAASDHLKATERLLPGFELVDFTQACCAAHAPPRLMCDVA